MTTNVHTVTITDTETGPRILFTCHGDRDSECHFYPTCECENYQHENHQDHPKVKQDDCWMKVWFDSGNVDPSDGRNGFDNLLADAGYAAGMAGPVWTEYEVDYLSWCFAPAECGCVADDPAPDCPKCGIKCVIV